MDKAQELGRLIGQSDDYKVLKRARQRLEEAPELSEKINRLERVAENLHQTAAGGKEPAEPDIAEYERLLEEIQSNSLYQGLVAAQANFDKLMLRVNEQIIEGLKKGSASPIITLG